MILRRILSTWCREEKKNTSTIFKKMLGHLFKTQFTVKLIYFEDPLNIHIYTRIAHKMRNTNTNQSLFINSIKQKGDIKKNTREKYFQRPFHKVKVRCNILLKHSKRAMRSAMHVKCLLLQSFVFSIIIACPFPRNGSLYFQETHKRIAQVKYL